MESKAKLQSPPCPSSEEPILFTKQGAEMVVPLIQNYTDYINHEREKFLGVRLNLKQLEVFENATWTLYSVQERYTIAMDEPSKLQPEQCSKALLQDCTKYHQELSSMNLMGKISDIITYRDTLCRYLLEAVDKLKEITWKCMKNKFSDYNGEIELGDGQKCRGVLRTGGVDSYYKQLTTEQLMTIMEQIVQDVKKPK